MASFVQMCMSDGICDGGGRHVIYLVSVEGDTGILPRPPALLTKDSANYLPIARSSLGPETVSMVCGGFLCVSWIFIIIII